MIGLDPADPSTVLRKLVDRTLEYDFSVWFWGDAIAIDGLLDAAELLDDQRALDHVDRFVRPWCERPVLTWPDHLAPGRALLRLHELTGDSLYLDGAVRLARRLAHDTPRSSGAPLYRPDQPAYRHTVWVDTIYHVPPFYAALARATDDERWVDEALREWHAHTALLSSAAGPFLAHSFDTGSKTVHGYGWGRGVGWALYGMVETLELLPPDRDGVADAREEVVSLARAVCEAQDATGFWHTLLHDRESYLESSTASFFAAAFHAGIAGGLLPVEMQPVADAAWDAMIGRVDDDGALWGVSACTWAGVAPTDDVTMYRTLPTEANVWGQGSALRAAAMRATRPMPGMTP